MVIQYTNGTAYPVKVKDSHGIVHDVAARSSVNIFMVSGLRSVEAIRAANLHFIKVQYCSLSKGWRKI